MDRLQFSAPPTRDGIAVEVAEVLLDREDCLVTYSTTEFSFISGENVAEGVDVLWPRAEDWRFATAWVYPGDLWLADCDEVVREETP